MKILFLAADPTDQARLRLTEEHREISEKIRSGRLGDEVELSAQLAVRATDLQEVLLRERPTAVHFSGHGTKDGELVFEGPGGEASVLSSGAIADLFRILKRGIRLVLLNACYSKPQGEALAQVVDCVVGMTTAVGDRAAITFSSAFYRALAYGESVQTAFDLGRNALTMFNILEADTPELLVRDGVDAKNVFLNGPSAQAAQNGATPANQPVRPGPDVRQAIQLFYSYAHEDEGLREKLQKHLAVLRNQGLISEWHDREITAGTAWKGQIDVHLDAADVILLLVSDSFLSSAYCYDVELSRAMERHRKGDARVIPIILRPCDWASASFSGLQALPKDAKPITQWGNRDAAFTEVARGLRRVVDEIRRARR